MTNINKNPRRIMELIFPSIPINLATFVVIFGKIAIIIMLPQTTILVPILSMDCLEKLFARRNIPCKSMMDEITTTIN